MKKRILLFIPVITIILSSCANSGHLKSKNNPMASLFASSSNETTTSATIYSVVSSNTSEVSIPTYEKIDIDLTTMSATMVFSEVFNMLDNPKAYVGKIVKVAGQFIPYESISPNYCYPAIIVQDATACCSNGLEFLLYGVPRCSMKGGNGYPLYGEEATIVGRFERYLESGGFYVHLVDAIWLKD